MYDVVAPICRAKGVPATFFPTTAFLDNRNLAFFHKASILADHCLGAEAARRQASAWATSRGYQEPIHDFASFFRSFGYRQALLLDECAERLGIDFSAYLERERPYLTTQQVATLLRDGFSIGCHSVDHPLYSQLNLAKQIEQTRMSVLQLRSQYGCSIRAFAFPFVADGVPSAFYETAIHENLIDVFFCVGQMPVSPRTRAVERFGVENRRFVPIERILADFQRRRALKRMRARFALSQER